MSVVCNNCDTILKVNAKFCSKCGTAQFKSNSKKREASLNIIIVFYVVFLLFAFISNMLYDEVGYDNLTLEIVIESVFILLVVGFSATDFKSIFKLYKLPKFNWKIIAFSVVFPIFSAFSVSFAVEWVNTSLFEGISQNYYGEYVYLDNPLFWGVLFIAILPPIFEELAFRGFLFNKLNKVVNTKVTIVSTAFLFALVHFSFISLIWIFPFGLILGYIRSKYKTLWYGVIIHFIHNLIVFTYRLLLSTISIYIYNYL